MNVKFESDNALSAIQRIAHFYFNAGVKIEIRDKKQGLTKKSLKERTKHMIIPSIWLKYAPSSPLNFHAAIRYVWNQTLGLGFGASTDGALIFDAHVNIKKRVRVGYAFSFPANDYLAHLGTNHEIMLTYIFGSKGNGWMFEEAPQQLVFKKKKKEENETSEEKSE